MVTLFWLAVGYCLAVLFPVPWLSQFIINGWKKLLGVAKPVVDNIRQSIDKK